MPMMNMKPPMMSPRPSPPDMGGGGGDDDDSIDAILEELQRAEDAGEMHSANSFFAPVPGADDDSKGPDAQDAMAMGGDAAGGDGKGLDDDKLQALLMMLKKPDAPQVG